MCIHSASGVFKPKAIYKFYTSVIIAFHEMRGSDIFIWQVVNSVRQNQIIYFLNKNDSWNFKRIQEDMIPMKQEHEYVKNQ